MNIEIVTKHVDQEDQIRDYIENKIHVAIDRMHVDVNRISVRLQDESAGSAAFDGHCQIDLSIAPSGRIHVSARGNSPRDTLMQAIRKMETAVKHDIDRHRRSARVRHEQTKQKFYAGLSENIAGPDDK